jgi:NADH-quinone oxidoreductase subunit L
MPAPPLPLTLLLLAMALPLAAFVILSAAGRRLGSTFSGALGTTATTAAFVCSLISLMYWLAGGVTGPDAWGAGRGSLVLTTPWTAGIVLGLHVDSLSILLVTAGLMASFAIHVFTTGYLRNDVRAPRTFAQLSLANASFVGLMTSASLPQFGAWALVASVTGYLLSAPVPLGPGGLGVTPVPRGLTSADLPKRSAAALAMFLARAIGDALLLLACTALFAPAPGLGFPAVWQVEPGGAAAWLLLAASACYSMAFPFSLLLPDAKGAPTPAGGLLYAITLLPTGPILLARIFPVLDDSQLTALAVIGASTAVISALLALIESDLRRFLACLALTVTGVSLLAVSVGSPQGAVLNVVAVTFSVSLLSLAAGSILHACMGERRLSRYGGLLYRMPASALLLTHGIGSLLGGPLLVGSGAWSSILAHAYRSSGAGEMRGTLALLAGFTVLVLLAAACGRVWWLLLAGKPRDRLVYAAARESATLTVPVAILALVATVAGDPVLSPVRQLTVEWPGEMSRLMAGAAAQDADAQDHNGTVTWPGLSRMRPITPPVIPPPPAPDDPRMQSELEAQELPPDDKPPPLIDPLRWTLAGLALPSGALLPLLLRRRLSVAPLVKASRVTSRLYSIATSSVVLASTLARTVEAFALEPLLSTLGRIVMPLRTSPPTRTHSLSPGRAVLMTLLASALSLAAVLAMYELLRPVQP